MDGISHFLTPQDVTRLSRLAIGSRFTVEGSMTGAHRSQLKGISVNRGLSAICRRRPQAPGLESLWKNERRTLGSTKGKPASGYTCSSMLQGRWHTQEANSQFSYASRLTAAELAYITVRRQDNVGLALFDKKCRSCSGKEAKETHLGHLQYARRTPTCRVD